MVEIKPNMYVRTRYGYIARLKKINKTDRYTEYEFDNKIGYDYDGFFHSIVEDYIDDIEIIKSSYNIIDLIEVGDYVNGFEVLRIDKECDLYPKTLKCQYPNNTDYFDIFNEDIKSIVTKEQFDAMKYEVE